jgi:pimeloyl-ACP methyl ester carboxylesterase
MRIRLIVLALCLTACNSVRGSLTPSPEAAQPAAETVRPATPTLIATPPPIISASQVVTFTTADGVNLRGTLYGDGTTAVILSTMGAQRQETWTPFAREIAAHGYLALTYNFRYWVTDTKMQDNLRDKAAEDLRAAVAFARKQGAQRVVLVGASLGALASIKAAGDSQPAAVVIMAAPFGPFPALPSLQVNKADLQAITAPKLFINTEHDEGGFTESTRQMFEAAPDPKELHIYPGSAHGTDLFDTEQAADLTRRLIEFIERNAPAAR